MKTKYMNPYLAGFFLGLVLLAAIFVTGRGLGASGAIKSIVVATVDGVAPTHAEQSSFYGSYVGAGKDNPLKSWLVFEIAGVLIGGFLVRLDFRKIEIRKRRRPAHQQSVGDGCLLQLAALCLVLALSLLAAAQAAQRLRAWLCFLRPASSQ